MTRSFYEWLAGLVGTFELALRRRNAKPSLVNKLDRVRGLLMEIAVEIEK